MSGGKNISQVMKYQAHLTSSHSLINGRGAFVAVRLMILGLMGQSSKRATTARHFCSAPIALMAEL